MIGLDLESYFMAEADSAKAGCRRVTSSAGVAGTERHPAQQPATVGGAFKHRRAYLNTSFD